MCPGGLCCPRGAGGCGVAGAWAALASRVRECHDAGRARKPYSPLLTVTSCWSDQQTAFAYVKNTHSSRLSYSPRQHLRLPGAAARAGLAAKPWGAAGSAAGHAGDPDTCAGAGASRTGWCWALRAPSLVRRGSGVGLRDTPVPGQGRHWCLGGPNTPCGSSRLRAAPAHAAHGRAPDTAAPHRDSCANTWRAPGKREPGVRQGAQGTPPTTPGEGSCSHGLALLQHLAPHSHPRPPPPPNHRAASPQAQPAVSRDDGVEARWGCPGARR